MTEPIVKVGQIYEARSGNRYRVSKVVDDCCSLKVVKNIEPNRAIDDPESVIHSPILNGWKLLPNIRQLPDHLKGKL